MLMDDCVRQEALFEKYYEISEEAQRAVRLQSTYLPPIFSYRDTPDPDPVHAPC